MDKFSKHRVCLNLASDEIYKIYDELQSLSTTITKEKPLFDGILSKDELVILVTPIDASSPKGRLILPQITAIRLLFKHLYPKLQHKLTFTNSPKELKITTFSIIMTRKKGNIAIVFKARYKPL